MPKTKEKPNIGARNRRKLEIIEQEMVETRGRPTSYEPRFCQMLIDHFDQEPTEDEDIKHFKGGELNWIDKRQKARKIPSLTKFCKIIDRSWQTIHDWLKPESSVFEQLFLDAYTYARAIRQDFLIDGALTAHYPPNTFKFIAVNLTDMRDKQEVEHTAQFKDIAALMQAASKERTKQIDSREVLRLPTMPIIEPGKEKEHV